jgi:hypothetical protein
MVALKTIRPERKASRHRRLFSGYTTCICCQGLYSSTLQMLVRSLPFRRHRRNCYSIASNIHLRRALSPDFEMSDWTLQRQGARRGRIEADPSLTILLNLETTNRKLRTERSRLNGILRRGAAWYVGCHQARPENVLAIRISSETWT